VGRDGFDAPRSEEGPALHVAPFIIISLAREIPMVPSGGRNACARMVAAVVRIVPHPGYGVTRHLCGNLCGNFVLT